MKITIEQYEHKIIHEVPHNDVTLEEALDMIEGLLKATGYYFKGNLEIVEEWHENEGEDNTFTSDALSDLRRTIKGCQPLTGWQENQTNNDGN